MSLKQLTTSKLKEELSDVEGALVDALIDKQDIIMEIARLLDKEAEIKQLLSERKIDE